MSINPWEYYVNNEYNIILDTCSLMNSGFTDSLIDSLISSLKANRKKVCVPEKVREELRYHLKNNSTKKQAERAWTIITKLDQLGLMYIDRTGSNIDSRFADTAIDSIVSRDMASKNILLVSQDHNLVLEVLNKMNNRAIRTKKIIAKKVHNGSLISHGAKNVSPTKPQAKQPALITNSTKPQEHNKSDNPYRDPNHTICLTTISDCELAVKEQLDLNNYRHILNKTIQFAENREEFEILYTLLNLIDLGKCSRISYDNKQKVAKYFIDKVFDEITGEHCMKYRVLFQQSIRFRHGFETWSDFGRNKRNEKFLSKFVEIALKYDKDFVKRHYYEED